MESFNVRWSTSSIVITAITGLVLLGFFIYLLVTHKGIKDVATIAFIIVVLSSIGLIGLIPTKIQLGNGELTVHRVFGNKTFRLDEINKAFIPKDVSALKLCGSGGLCGNIGWYRSDGLGIYFSYVMDKDQSFCIILSNGDKYMLSCDDSKKLATLLSNQ